MKVGVIGAGTMGSGIAQAFAQSAEVETVYLCDIKQEFADGGKARIAKGLNGRVAKGKMTQEAADEIINKIQAGLNTQCVDADLIVEAALEVMGVKQKTFKELQEEIVKNPNCIYASNTSSLSITEISKPLNTPVIGMHFFNPAPVMKLVEVNAGYTTPQEDVAKVVEIAEKLGKTPVQVKEAPGFVVNRILIPMINEGIFILHEGTSSIEGIDTAMKLGANHPMGPLELGDLVGLDICLYIMETLYDETDDSKYRPCPLLRKMVRANHLGRKTGIGFYRYNEDGTKTPVDELGF